MNTAPYLRDSTLAQQQYQGPAFPSAPFKDPPRTSSPAAAAAAAGAAPVAEGGGGGGHVGPSSSKAQHQEAGASSLRSVTSSCIIVSRRQQGNPVLGHIRNVRWGYGDIVPDFLLGSSTCALFLQLRYHLLHPDYIFVRIRELQTSFRLRLLLCYVDTDDVTRPLQDITKTALLHDLTLLCAWSAEECARYLETIKAYENKPAENIKEKLDNDYISRLSGALTSVRHVNKTDALTLCQTFGTLGGVLGAPMEELIRCPGIGEKKVRRLHDTFHEPFKRHPPKAPRLSLPPPLPPLPPLPPPLQGCTQADASRADAATSNGSAEGESPETRGANEVREAEQGGSAKVPSGSRSSKGAQSRLLDAGSSREGLDGGAKVPGTEDEGVCRGLPKQHSISPSLAEALGDI